MPNQAKGIAVGDRAQLGAIADVHDVGLLQVGLRRRRQGARAQELEQVRRDVLVQDLAMRAVLENACELIHTQGRVGDVQFGTEAL